MKITIYLREKRDKQLIEILQQIPKGDLSEHLRNILFSYYNISRTGPPPLSPPHTPPYTPPKISPPQTPPLFKEESPPGEELPEEKIDRLLRNFE